MQDACGQDCLAEVKSRGMYKEFKRTYVTGIMAQQIIDLYLPNQGGHLNHIAHPENFKTRITTTRSTVAP